jgi:1-acyl-sn-glycerol-3-phosphate acyltransferase
MREFYPPQLNLLLVRFVQMVAPWGAHCLYQIDIDVDTESLKRLSAVRDQRVLLLPNHPTFQDPIVTFLLTGCTGEAYHYLAAYEQFQGILGRFLQSIGVYSIRRGVADRSSIAQTLELLSQPGCHLVIFPEGGCSFQNDTVMPFRVGGVQLAFQAMNRLVKQGSPVPDFYVLPVSIKYRYTRNMTQVIDRTLSRLEQALQLPSTADNYVRLRQIAEQVLIRVEQAYGIQFPSQPEPTWDDRIAALKAYVLKMCEQSLGIASASGDADRERVYRIQYALQAKTDLVERGEAIDNGTFNLEAMQKATLRVLNFDAIYDGYVAENPTPERFLDTLIRLEREVFEIDQPPSKGHRIAYVRVGEPVNLKAHFADYQQHRTRTIARLVQRIQQTVQTNLDLLNRS